MVAGREPLRAAIYARVSTLDQEPENQLAELRGYTEARGWDGREYVDRGVSGMKDRRPELDRSPGFGPGSSTAHRGQQPGVCWTGGVSLPGPLERAIRSWKITAISFRASGVY